jgi:LysM repeat protein
MLLLADALLLVPFGGADTTYRIEKGDNLYRIARKYGVTVKELLEINDIADPTRISVGTVIRIPTGSISPRKEGGTILHSIEPGDTLWGLAKRYGVKLEDLLRANDLGEESILGVGDVLFIPGEPAETLEEGHSREDPMESGVPFWPHPGEVIRLEGKLSSVVAIIGEPGDRIVAVSPGRVEWAAPFRGYGKVVLVRGDSDTVYLYGGSSELYVDVGDEITVGTELGALGVNSHDGVAKVFFSVSKGGQPFEPFTAPRR